MKEILQRKYIPLITIFVLIIGIFSAPNALAAETMAPATIYKNVLIIHQFSEQYPAHQLFNKGLIDEIEKDGRYNCNYAYEYLNMDKYSDNEEYLKATADYLKLKHINSNRKPDIVFASDGVADFLSKYGKKVFIDVPIVTIWAGEGDAPSDILAKNFVISAPPNYHENIHLIKSMQQNLKKIYVVIGNSKGEKNAIIQVEKAAENYKNQIEFVYMNDLSYNEMMEALRQASDGSVILFVRWLMDTEGKSFMPLNVLKKITEEAKVPVYGTQMQYLGAGIVGGYLYDQSLIGKSAARIGLSLMSGEEIKGLLITDSQFHKYSFDVRALELWGINLNTLPKKSKIEYKEEDLWSLYGKYVVVGGIIILLESTLIIGLIRTRKKRKKAEDELLVLNTSLEKMVDERTQELQEAKVKLEILNEQLTGLSMIDALTGLYNRRHMEERLNDEYQKFKRTEQGFSIMIADIDDFKKVNDKYGHDTGDTVLKTLSKNIREIVREYDVVARWGGEEFLMLFPNLMNGDSEGRAEEIRKAVERQGYLYENQEFSVTLTIGVATIIENETIEEAIKRADNALYEGKETGKNKVVIG